MYFAFAELVGGLAGITGAYFAGLFHRRGDDHGHAQGIIAPFAQTILLPLFLGSVGLQLNISILTFGQWLLVGYVLVLALFSKFCACFIAMLISNWGVRDEQQRWSWLDGFLFGASMVARGEVGLVVSTVLCGSALITQEQYIIAVVAIVLTTVASPVLLAAGLSYLQVVPELVGQAEFSCTIGPFAHTGTSRMFDIIGTYMQARQTHLSTSLNQERQMITLDGEKVKIILCPQEGIVLQGDKGRIQAILVEFQKALNDENRRLLPSALQK
jgi:Kef-type K+ transport system membrane component KefB